MLWSSLHPFPNWNKVKTVRTGTTTEQHELKNLFWRPTRKREADPCGKFVEEKCRTFTPMWEICFYLVSVASHLHQSKWHHEHTSIKFHSVSSFCFKARIITFLTSSPVKWGNLFKILSIMSTTYYSLRKCCYMFDYKLSFFLFFCSTGVWTLGFHLESLHSHFLWRVFLR
jgi:hypothetical protein